MSRRTQPIHSACVEITGLPDRRGVIFTEPADYRAFQHHLAEALQRCPARLMAYCLMPGWWQLIMGATDPVRLQRCLARVGTAHGTPTILTRPLSGTNDVIRAARDTERHGLTARLVRRAQDWPWSSLAGRHDGRNPLPLVQASFLESRAWLDFVNAPTPADLSHHVTQHPRRLADGLEGRHDRPGV